MDALCFILPTKNNAEVCLLSLSVCILQGISYNLTNKGKDQVLVQPTLLSQHHLSQWPSMPTCIKKYQIYMPICNAIAFPPRRPSLPPSLSLPPPLPFIPLSLLMLFGVGRCCRCCKGEAKCTAELSGRGSRHSGIVAAVNEPHTTRKTPRVTPETLRSDASWRRFGEAVVQKPVHCT
jgi:hypothetical protein